MNAADAAGAAHEELDYLVRALSHDMGANFMLLENSFRQLKRSLIETRRGVIEDPVHRRIDHVDACLRESRGFLDDLVSLARTGQVEMEPRRVDASDVVDEALFELRDRIDARGAWTTVSRPLPEFWCNPSRLKQIAANLIRNALAHGCDRSDPQIRIEPTVVDVTGRLAAFQIVDNGPGVAAEHRREIFLPGRRAPGADAAGSGMGLAIVKKICNYYGGDVWIDETASEGTAFVVALPTPADADPPTDGSADGRRWRLQLDGHEDERSFHPHGTRVTQPEG